MSKTGSVTKVEQVQLKHVKLYSMYYSLFVPLQKSLFEGLEESDPTLLDTFRPRSSIKRLILKPKAATPISGQPTTQSPATIPGQTDMLEADKENKDVHQTSIILPEQREDSWYVFEVFYCIKYSQAHFAGGETVLRLTDRPTDRPTNYMEQSPS
jgi:hypothetical protein